MAAERSPLIGVQTQPACMAPQEASINAHSDGDAETGWVAKLAAMNRRRSVNFQRLGEIGNDGVSYIKAIIYLLLALATLADSISMIVIAGVILLVLFLGIHYRTDRILLYYGCGCFLFLFFMAWQITGAVWVSNVKDVEINGYIDPRYCYFVVYDCAKYLGGIGTSFMALLNYYTTRCAF
ncbi:uncharacterized protein LOC135394779 isoform X3 [Ornithodoros turicata]|uniref:uncharacterized protein LOC135394779 isoform X3 n=1 Tax=Ornithodoros turicata TaxID=34597 RepID=UPI003139156D